MFSEPQSNSDNQAIENSDSSIEDIPGHSLAPDHYTPKAAGSAISKTPSGVLQQRRIICPNRNVSVGPKAKQATVSYNPLYDQSFFVIDAESVEEVVTGQTNARVIPFVSLNKLFGRILFSGRKFNRVLTSLDIPNRLCDVLHARLGYLCLNLAKHTHG